MKIKTIALYVYFIACITAIVGIIGDFELLTLVAKPVIIPAIYFYYLAIVRKPNLIFTSFLIINFIGDSIVILNLEDPLFIMIPFFIGYLILLKFVIQDVVTEKLNLTNVGYAIILMAFLMFVLSLLIDIPNDNGFDLALPIIIFGIVLAILVSLATYNYLTDKTISGYYLLIACGCSLISDVFYILYNLHFKIPVLDYINISMQFLSYYLFVKYMLARKNNRLRENSIG